MILNHSPDDNTKGSVCFRSETAGRAVCGNLPDNGQGNLSFQVSHAICAFYFSQNADFIVFVLVCGTSLRKRIEPSL